MAERNGQVLLSTWVSTELAARFRGWARGREGGVSASLRRLISDAAGDEAPPPPPGASGRQIMVRLKDAERLSLLRAAKERSTTPANWLRSLAIVHLGQRPQWNDSEVAALREIGQELRRIGNNVNQIARALNVAVMKGEYSPRQGDAAKEASEMVRAELRRLMAIYTGNFDYWGLPDADRPVAARENGRIEREREKAAKEKRRLRRGGTRTRPEGGEASAPRADDHRSHESP
jgi:hypothetical protein